MLTSPLSTNKGEGDSAHEYQEVQEHEVDQIWQPESPSFYAPNLMVKSRLDRMSFSTVERSNIDLSPSSNQSYVQIRHRLDSDYLSQPSLTPQSTTEFIRESNTSASRSPLHTEDAAAELLALRYMPSQLSQTLPMPMLPPGQSHGNQLEDHIGDQIFGDVDDIFLPGSTYQELHSTLRDHLIYTARSNAPTRHGTPEPYPDMGIFDRLLARNNSNDSSDVREAVPDKAHSPKVQGLTPQREYGELNGCKLMVTLLISCFSSVENLD